jgi:hypothetical protein
MAKKDRVKMHCQICNKDTFHEVRTNDEQESCVCLECEKNQKALGNAALNYENRYQTDKYETQRAIEAERLRTFSPGG